jgi:hypothetical protein
VLCSAACELLRPLPHNNTHQPQQLLDPPRARQTVDYNTMPPGTRVQQQRRSYIELQVLQKHTPIVFRNAAAVYGHCSITVLEWLQCYAPGVAHTKVGSKVPGYWQ